MSHEEEVAYAITSWQRFDSQVTDDLARAGPNALKEPGNDQAFDTLRHRTRNASDRVQPQSTQKNRPSAKPIGQRAVNQLEESKAKQKQRQRQIDRLCRRLKHRCQRGQ